MIDKNKILLLLVLLFSPCQIPIVGGIEVAGATLNLAKDVAVLVLVALAAVFMKLRPARSDRLFSLVLALWFVVLVVSQILAPSFLTGIQYFIKMILPLLVFLYFRNANCFSIDWRWFLGVLLIFLILFSVVSLFSGWVMGDLSSGITSRHYFKFNAVLLFLLGFSSFILGFRRQIALVAMFVSAVSIYFILQRGALICIFAGCFVVLFSNGFFSPKKAVISILIFVFSTWALLNSEKFLEYSFYDGMGPGYIAAEFMSGNFDTSFIRDRERGALIEAMTIGYDNTFLPNGLGEAKHRINRSSFYFEGKEPHNDFLVLLIDTGYLGLFLYSLIFLTVVIRGFNDVKNIGFDCNAPIKILLSTGLGMLVGTHVWMFFSNVIVYASASLVVPFGLVAIGSNFCRRIRTSATLC